MLAKQLNLPYHIAGAYWGKALSYMYQGQNKNAIVNFEMALNIFNKKLDRRELELKANILKDKGTILNSTGEYDKALELYKKSLDIGYALKDTSIILGSTNCIGVLYMAIADWQTALKYMQKITAILERDSLQNANKNYKVQGVYISSLVNTGNILGILKRYDDAIPPLKKALETQTQISMAIILYRRYC
jgi:tetratricopeptide (TPR) repeat protein